MTCIKITSKFIERQNALKSYCKDEFSIEEMIQHINIHINHLNKVYKIINMESLDNLIEKNYNPSSYEYKKECTHFLLTEALVNVLKQCLKYESKITAREIIDLLNSVPESDEEADKILIQRCEEEAIALAAKEVLESKE